MEILIKIFGEGKDLSALQMSCRGGGHVFHCIGADPDIGAPVIRRPEPIG